MKIVHLMFIPALSEQILTFLSNGGDTGLGLPKASLPNTDIVPCIQIYSYIPLCCGFGSPSQELQMEKAQHSWYSARKQKIPSLFKTVLFFFTVWLQ